MKEAGPPALAGARRPGNRLAGPASILSWLSLPFPPSCRNPAWKSPAKSAQ